MPDPVTPVVRIVSEAATPAVTSELATDLAPVVAGAAAAGVSKAGWITLTAGTAGLALNLYNTWKTANETGKGFGVGSIFGATTVSIGIGAGLFMLGEKGIAGSSLLTNGLRGAGIALVLGGLAGAVMGAVRSVGSVVDHKPTPGSSEWQSATKFEQALPSAPTSLRGIKVGTADVITGKRDPLYVPMYVDPATASPIPAGSSLTDAIAIARRAAQSDEQFRSYAVIKTADQALWTVRLAGDIDQVDGMNYAQGNTFNPSYHPDISKHQQSLQAIAGVEELYVFPENADATAPVQDVGDIPWLDPGQPVPNPVTPVPADTAPVDTATAAAGG